MSTLFKAELDGGDLDVCLRRHQTRKRWLREAEDWLSSDRGDERLTNYDIRMGDGPAFHFDVPRSVWEPQLRSQFEEVKRQVDELDGLVRGYVEAALKL